MLPRIYRARRQSSSVVVRSVTDALWAGAPVVNFDDGVARATAQAREDRGVGARREGHCNRGFSSVAGREPGGGDFGGVRRIILPVVVCVKENAIAIVQFKRRILERIRNAGRSEARSQA